MERSESIKEIAAALCKAQRAMGAAIKDSNNPFFNSRYADLASIIDAIKEPLSGNGLSYVQVANHISGEVVVETILMHTSGEWILGSLAMKPTKDDPQGVGSCITYARRYGLQAMVGIPADDDDGNAASAAAPPTRESSVRPTAAHGTSGTDSAPTTGVRKITEAQKKLLFVRAKAAGVTEEDLKEYMHVEHLLDIPAEAMTNLLSAIADGTVKKAVSGQDDIPF